MRSLPDNSSFADRNKRSGTAMVEMAVCLPVLVFLVFGAIEAAEFIHLKQDLAICTYEAAKIASKGSKVNSDVTTRFNEMASAKSMNNATLSISPTLTSSTASGTEVTLTATVQADANYSLPMRFFSGISLTKRVVVSRQNI
ncbi:TadE/TadG family type IV pilus assembly protein [Rubinisphaera sp.]|uniref:TadE/TadG family type IV pilus assembly protein n=1 Tax=Rubinisphaera sp. TaxID=2024857 RepID=UPI000C10F4F2|nr:TadE/TadG family type IV pilus assembly protein [Rubinisphaera sp.]MBV12064.1 hypothetical protein [Rubinisphaera sp.]HCS51247.1 hypothetical protein [Planctomycetaceae bacterium]|tara:strand:- start:4801 stop:5226 length:426 start_codon:yes stop_codon:yes gene_type:complete